jgi:hypothetical protein
LQIIILTNAVFYDNMFRRKVKTKMPQNPNQLSNPGGDLSSEEHRNRIRDAHDEGSLEPGSEKESDMLQAMQAARRDEENQRVTQAIGTQDSPGPVAEELSAIEQGKGYVDPEGSQDAHRQGEIKISRAGEQTPDGDESGPIDVSHLRRNAPGSPEKTLH